MRTYSIYETRWGCGALVFGKRGLQRVFFPEADMQAVLDRVNELDEPCVRSQERDYGLSSSIAGYFNGERKGFDVEVDFGGLSEFERHVLEVLRRIPYGNTFTYSGVAALCGRPRAARAVGNAVGKNPVPVVVPCHRVIRSDSGIGGWSGPPCWKERLLAIEGIELK